MVRVERKESAAREMEESREVSKAVKEGVKVTVETLEKGFLINVYSEKNCSGLLVSILEAFEELGLDVLDARVSCSDNFQLEAIGGENIEGQVEGNIDAQMVKQSILQAINNWSESNEQK
ncbi:hypothetical protein JRO89_XS12G0081100 [Xanthoceras sorbifolium]|uniref:Plant bHLH transcription factor ACT-like domain-containing protein n=1 Tax=Xanthoceras sorbifolium TaxID=99658 RepID=A0ABQ8HBY6_9ROSI|nr:hypothetical protein JRO89_XS12G0081100 [Xanthoceras sorbifolium]